MKYTLGLLIAVMLCTTAFAQEDQILVKKSDIPKEILDQIQMDQKVEAFGKWVGFGKEIGAAVDGSLSAISDNAIELSETSIGKTAIFLVIWKLLFKDMAQFGVGVCFTILVTVISTRIYNNNIKPRKIVISEDGDKKKYEMFHPLPNRSDDMAAALIMFSVFTVLAYALCCLIMFV